VKAMKMRHQVAVGSCLLAASIVLIAYARFPEPRVQISASPDDFLRDIVKDDPALGIAIANQKYTRGEFLLVFPQCVTGCTAGRLLPETYILKENEVGIIMDDAPKSRSNLTKLFGPKFKFEKFNLSLAKLLNIAWAGRWVRVKNGHMVQLQPRPGVKS